MDKERGKRAQRNAGLDAMKTWAIFGVIFYHSFTASIDVNAGGALAWIHYFVYSALCFCVPLFFLVNGYLLFSKPFNIRRHVQRTLRIIALSILWQIVTLLILMPVKGETLSAGDLLQAVLYSKAGWTDHFWFMGSLSVAYLFFPVAKAAFDHARGSFWFFLLVTALLTFGNTALNMAGNTAAFFLRGRGFETENFFSMFNAFAGNYGFTLGYFLLGGALSLARERIERIPGWACAVAAVACALGQWGYGLLQSAWRGATWDSVFLGYDTIFALVGAVSLFLLSQRMQMKGKKAALYARMGGVTLPMYIIQGVLIPALRPVVNCWGIADNLLFAAVFALALFAICALLSGCMKKISGVRAFLHF